jgi:hypothetical protein
MPQIVGCVMCNAVKIWPVSIPNALVQTAISIVTAIHATAVNRTENAAVYSIPYILVITVRMIQRNMANAKKVSWNVSS